LNVRAFLGLSLALPGMAGPIAVAAECPVTHPAGGFYGNEYLKAGLPPGGKLVFTPGGPGFVDQDGALGIKFAWDRLVPGDLYVGGRRLDGDAPPARAYMSGGYGDGGFQPSYLVFPTPGCWEITGWVGERKLTFVLLVEKIGEGPSWRFKGIGPDWRVTNGPKGVSAEAPPR
jgi:hypothetical protein